MVEHSVCVWWGFSPSTRCVFSLSSRPRVERSRAGIARCWARTPAGSHYTVFVRQSKHVARIEADLRTGTGPSLGSRLIAETLIWGLPFGTLLLTRTQKATSITALPGVKLKLLPIRHYCLIIQLHEHEPSEEDDRPNQPTWYSSLCNVESCNCLVKDYIVMYVSLRRSDIRDSFCLLWHRLWVHQTGRITSWTTTGHASPVFR